MTYRFTFRPPLPRPLTGLAPARTAVSRVLAALVASAFLLPAPGNADTETVDGVSWKYTISGGTATIGGGLGEPSGTVSIPHAIGGCPVTSFGNYAFSGCPAGLASISIPDSVTDIEFSTAFRKCGKLKSVRLPVRFKGKIPERAFPECCRVTFH